MKSKWSGAVSCYAHLNSFGKSFNASPFCLQECRCKRHSVDEFGFVHCRICQDSIKPNQTLNSKLSNCPMFNVSLTQVQVFSDDLWGTDFGQTRQKRFATSPYHKPPSPRPHGFERNLHVCTQFLRYKLQSKPAVFHCLPSWRSQRATLKIRQVEAGCPSGWHQVDLLKTKFGNQT